MTRELIDLPAWVHEVIAARALALGVDFDDALLASLSIGVHDSLAESAGWAVERGATVAQVARRVHYSRSAVRAANERYRRRLPNVGG